MRQIAVVIFVVAQLCGAQNAPGLAGRWRSVETSKGGIGAMYQFRADGTAEFSPGAVVDMPYRVEAGQLIFPPETTSGPEQKSALTFAGENVLRISTGGFTEEYRRQGALQDPGQPLLGEWLGARTMDGRQMPVRLFFYANGRSLLLISFTSEVGAYQITGARLVATFGGKPGLDGSFDIADGILSIHRSNGRVTRLARY